MAGEKLESTFIIQDEASKVLKNIARQSDIAGDALAEVQKALNSLETVGEVKIKTAIKADNAPKAHGAKGTTSDWPDYDMPEPPPMDDYWPDYAEFCEIMNEAAEATKETTQNIKEMSEATNEIAKVANATKEANESSFKRGDTNGQIEDKYKDYNFESFEEEINAKLNDWFNPLIEAPTIKAESEKAEQEIAEAMAAEVEADAAKILEEGENVGNEIVEIMEEAQDEAERTGEALNEGLRGLGADIAGWWSIIKDIFSEIAGVFGKLTEEADKLNTRIARFGLIADNEGKTGTARDERSAELYKQHQKFAQALGVQSEAFNETVLNMYSNGEGVVKSIEEAQAIAASSYMAMDIAGLRGQDKDAVMGEVQSMVNVGIADPDQIQESMKIAPNILRTIEKQWQKNQNGKAFKLSSGEEITDATGKIATLAQEGQITADLVAQAMVNSAEETNKTWQTLPSTWEKMKNRVSVMVENMAFNILKKFGEIADVPQVADFVMSALKFGEMIVAFVENVVAPVVGGVLGAIVSVLTTIFSILGDWHTALAVFPAIALGLANIAIKAGLIPKVLGAIRVAMTALAAHPFMAIAGAIMIAVMAMAHLVRTTQTGQEIMLEVTAAISMAFQQVGTAIMNIPDIIYSAFRGVRSFISSYVTEILEIVAGALEKLAGVSDTARDAAINLRQTIAEREIGRARFDIESEELKKGWKGQFSANFENYTDYRKRIPEIAAENLTKNKDELKLTGFLEDILNGQKKAPGTNNNPANVKGKVAIDGEYFDIIKRAAGVEIVNRYTTLRPTVNATFGDIHQIDAGDVIGELGKQIQEAEGAAISDAQALGA